MTSAPPAPGQHPFTNTPDQPARLAYSIEETAALLGISRTSCYLAAQRGEIPSRVIGRRRVVPVAALRAYLAAQDGGNDA